MGDRTKWSGWRRDDAFILGFCDQTIPVQMVPLFSMIVVGMGYEKRQNGSSIAKVVKINGDA
jgi:hypothetical protein